MTRRSASRADRHRTQAKGAGGSRPLWLSEVERLRQRHDRDGEDPEPLVDRVGSRPERGRLVPSLEEVEARQTGERNGDVEVGADLAAEPQALFERTTGADEVSSLQQRPCARPVNEGSCSSTSDATARASVASAVRSAASLSPFMTRHSAMRASVSSTWAGSPPSQT